MANPTKEQLQERLNAMNELIASGARSVTLADSTVIYNTGDSLIRARDDLINQIGAIDAAVLPRRARQTYLFQNGRGYD